jgi:hypothetical protein
VPKRVIDGEALWRSDKLAQVEPPKFRAEYANLVPLALANGTFEATPRRVWSSVYSFNRPDVPTAELVEQLLDELERVKLLFRWTDPSTGKVWGFWVGIDKPGRLPGRSRRGRNEAVGLDPPPDELRKFLDSTGIHEAINGNGKLLGFGFGSGSGINPTSEQKSRSDPERTSSKKTTEPSREAHRLAALFKQEILRNKPDFNFRQEQERNWAVTVDQMLRLDGRTVEQISELIAWCQADDFEKCNVLSMRKLRTRFDELELKKRTRSNGRAVPKPATITGNALDFHHELLRGGGF